MVPALKSKQLSFFFLCCSYKLTLLFLWLVWPGGFKLSLTFTWWAAASTALLFGKSVLLKQADSESSSLFGMVTGPHVFFFSSYHLSTHLHTYTYAPVMRLAVQSLTSEDLIVPHMLHFLHLKAVTPVWKGSAPPGRSRVEWDWASRDVNSWLKKQLLCCIPVVFKPKRVVDILLRSQEIMSAFETRAYVSFNY